jgi:hypothetical protein
MTTRQQRRFEERKGPREPDHRPAPSAAEIARRTGSDPAPGNPTDPGAWGGKLNIYVCEVCRGHIVTRDVDEGVTPFMLPSGEFCPNKCQSPKPGGAHMTSSFYRVWDQRMVEDYQWYRPGEGDTVPQAYRHHVEQGGLLIRSRPVG